MPIKRQTTGLFLPYPAIHLESGAEMVVDFPARFKFKRFLANLDLGSWFRAVSIENRLPSPTARVCSDLKKAGLLEFVRLRENFFDHPKVFSFYAKHSSVNIDREGTKIDISSGGFSVSFEESFNKAVYEYCERLFSALIPTKRIWYGSVSGMRRKSLPFLDPVSLPLLSPEHPASKRYSPEVSIAWIEGRGINNEKILLPAQAVLWAYRRTTLGKSEPFIFHANTNGSAIHTSKERAQVKAAYELIERDGLLSHWLLRRTPKRLKPESLGEEVKNLSSDCEHYGFGVNLLVTSTDTEIPAVTSILVNNSSYGPKMTCSSAASFSYSSAALKALTETISGAGWARRLQESGKKWLEPVNPGQKSKIKTIEERLLLWANPDMFQHMEWFISGEKIDSKDAPLSDLSFKSDKEELVYLQARLRKALGVEGVYFYEAESDFLKKHGFYCTKAVAPGLLPMFFDESLAPIGAPRLGLLNQHFFSNSGPPTINSLPHPFL